MESKTRLSKRMRVMGEVADLMRVEPDFRERLVPPDGKAIIVALPDDRVGDVLGRIQRYGENGARVLLRKSRHSWRVATFGASAISEAPPADESTDTVDVSLDSEWAMLMDYAWLQKDGEFTFRTIAAQFGLELVGVAG